MNIAGRVAGGVAVVHAQRVVDGGSGVFGQDPELVARHPAAAFVQVVGGERVGAGHVQPLRRAGDAHAGLVDTDHRGPADHGLDQLVDVGQAVGGAGDL